MENDSLNTPILDSPKFTSSSDPPLLTSGGNNNNNLDSSKSATPPSTISCDGLDVSLSTALLATGSIPIVATPESYSLTLKDTIRVVFLNPVFWIFSLVEICLGWCRDGVLSYYTMYFKETFMSEEDSVFYQLVSAGSAGYFLFLLFLSFFCVVSKFLLFLFC